jgi:hypothetical protein
VATRFKLVHEVRSNKSRCSCNETSHSVEYSARTNTHRRKAEFSLAKEIGFDSWWEP